MVSEAKRMFQRRRTDAQWTSENPVLGAGEIGVILDSTPPQFKIGDGVTAWNDLTQFPELVADDPAEVDFVTTGDVTELTLTDLIARHAFDHGSGLYYHSNYGTSSAQVLTQDTLVLCPVWLSAGTIDSIGCEVTTAAASGIIRLGAWTDNGGVPGVFIAEAAATIDASTTGIKSVTASIAIPKNGRYWLGAVAQAAAGIAVQGGGTTAVVPVALGTTALGSTTGYMSRIRASTSGTLASLASPLTGLNSNAQGTRFRWHFRYT